MATWLSIPTIIPCLPLEGSLWHMLLLSSVISWSGPHLQSKSITKNAFEHHRFFSTKAFWETQQGHALTVIIVVILVFFSVKQREQPSNNNIKALMRTETMDSSVQVSSRNSFLRISRSPSCIDLNMSLVLAQLPTTSFTSSLMLKKVVFQSQ